MASSGKKGKKTKGKTFALNDFLQETPGTTPTIPLRKTNLNWADEVDDNYDQYGSRPKGNVVLPTAPKSARGFDEFSERIPQHPPFIAYITNLPYDVREEEIAEFFGELKISNMRIPREDRPGEPQRLKGYGYVEFKDRDSLIGALSITDCTLKTRRIRIEVADNSDNDRKRGNRMDNNRDRGDRPEVSMGDWRSRPRVDPPEITRNSGFSRDRDSGFSRDRDSGFSRDRDSGFSRDRDSGFSRDRDSGFSRDRDNGPNDRDKGGSWRDNRDRPSLKDMDRGKDSFNDRGRFSDRDGDRRGFGARRNDDRDFSRDSGAERVELRTRPKIVLQQRTIPLTTDAEQNDLQETPNTVPTSSSIFGGAKPVDTSIRERQIEELLAKQSEKHATDGRETRRDDRRDWNKRDDEGRWGRDRRKDSPIRRGSPDYRNDHSPVRNRNSYSQRNDSPDRKYSPERRRKLSPDYRNDSPIRRRSSPEYSRNSLDRRRNYSPDRGRTRSPDYRRTSPNYRRGSEDQSRYSPSPDRKDTSPKPERRRSPKTNWEHRKSSPETVARRDSSEHRRNSPERKKKSPDRSKLTRSIQRKSDDRDKKGSSKNEKSQKNDKEKGKREEKITRENQEREMPKMQEPETPNFAVSNKYAFLPEED